jgi:hypothetical protein
MISAGCKCGLTCRCHSVSSSIPGVTVGQPPLSATSFPVFFSLLFPVVCGFFSTVLQRVCGHRVTLLAVSQIVSVILPQQIAAPFLDFQPQSEQLERYRKLETHQDE